jgi:hypothetical protein
MKKLSCFLLLVFAIVAIAVGETVEITGVRYYYNVSHIVPVTDGLDSFVDDWIALASRDYIVSKIDKISNDELGFVMQSWARCAASYSTEYGDIFSCSGRIGYRLYIAFLVVDKDHFWPPRTKLYKVTPR